MDDEDIQQRMLVEKKWKKLLRFRKVFAALPFVDFTLAAGSLVYGTVKESSDLDVLVGVREGRMFTARFFCMIFFSVLGVRRKGVDSKSDVRDKICLNHFVAPQRYCLAPPYYAYWRGLYAHLIPLSGSRDAITRFFTCNACWIGFMPAVSYERFYAGRSIVKQIIEFFLAGFFGDRIERLLRFVQMRRIRRSMYITARFEPRLVAHDDELEFHPDTSRIEKILKEV